MTVGVTPKDDELAKLFPDESHGNGPNETTAAPSAGPVAATPSERDNVEAGTFVEPLLTR